MKKKVLVIHGPNLNLLGVREPKIYGRQTLEKVNQALSKKANSLGLTIGFFQSNHEGKIIDQIQKARLKYDGLLINPGGLSHTSVAIRDALSTFEAPKVEVHLTNPQSREEFRRQMTTAGAVHGVVSGFGAESYTLALQGLFALIER